MKASEVKDAAKSTVDFVHSLKLFHKLIVTLVFVVILGLVGAFVYRVACLTFVDNYQMAYTYDLWTGKLERAGRTGYIYANPFKKWVHTVDMRPMQVCINANQRVLNCKLVQFNPDAVDAETGKNGLDLFLSWHGRNDYEGPGNSSSTSSSSGGGSGTTVFSEILKSYAYEGTGKTYAFLTIVRELKSDSPQKAQTPEQGVPK